MLEGTYGRAAEAQPAMGGGSRRSRRGGLVWAAGGRRRQEIEDTRQMLDVNPTAGRQNHLLTSKSTPPWIGYFLAGPKCQNPNLSRSCSLSYENLQPI